MEFKEFINLLDETKKQPDFFSRGETSSSTIEKAEELLELKLSSQHKEFYRKMGYLSFSGYEFYGICNDNFTGKTSICAVETTLKDRKKVKLPKEWVIICSFDDGYYGYLDYSDLNSKGEPSLIMALSTKKKTTKIKKISNDFGSYLNSCLK